MLRKLCTDLSQLSIQSVTPPIPLCLKKVKNTHPTETVCKTKTTSILHPTFIKWYKDDLFYVYFLLAIAFWIIYALIFSTSWPSQTLTRHQWQIFSLIVIGYPIVEEFVFRGGLQNWLYKYPWAKLTYLHISVANIIVSILFSTLHIILRPDDNSTYGIIIPSLIFGLFKDRHRHIMSCTLLHIFYNMGAFFLIILPTLPAV